MSINPESLEILKGKKIHDTINDKYIIYEKKETAFPYADFKALGCLNGYMYVYADGYLIKNTLDQIEIAKIYIDVEAGVFKEGFDHMYLYKGNTLYSISENLNINWSVDFDDEIKDVVVDVLDNIYIIFENLRLIRKYRDGQYIGFYNESETFGHICKLHKLFIEDGGSDLYVIASHFWDSKAGSYIDHYDARKFTKIERMELYTEVNNVALYDPYFSYNDLYIDKDYIYIYANNYLEKRNIKMRSLWRYEFGYNQLTDYVDTLHKITFDDNKYDGRIFFCENLESSDGYSFGKLSPNGNLTWKILSPENEYRDKSEFGLLIYDSDIYICSKRNIGDDINGDYVLSLDNENVLVETRNGEVVRIKDNNYDLIYAPENYIGMYLLGSKHKADVPEYKDYLLAHDKGIIVGDDAEEDKEGNLISEKEPFVLLVTDYNPDYNNAENYEYFKLIGFSNPGLVPDMTYIQTLNGNRLLTIGDSYIETLYPYDKDNIYQQVKEPDGTLISPNDNPEVIKDFFYLLADYHKFLSHIITKNKELTIITKKSEFAIARKVKYVHRYFIKRLADIDIMVEYLEQRGLLETLLPRYAEKLKYYTETNIAEVQKWNVPRLYDMNITKVYGYMYQGQSYPLRVNHTQMFLCKNLPYNYKRRRNSTFIEPMISLIRSGELTPFLLFMDGQLIKWSDIVVIRDWSYSYIVINNCDNISKNIDTVILPRQIKYREGTSIGTITEGDLYFDKDGLLTTDKTKVYTIVEFVDSLTHKFEPELDNGYLNLGKDLPEALVTTDTNILAFKDGKLFSDLRFYLDYVGMNIYKYIEESANVIFKSYYYLDSNKSKNMIYDIPNQEYVQPEEAEVKVTLEDDPVDIFEVSLYGVEHIDAGMNGLSNVAEAFKAPFDFKFSRDNTYSRNISEAIAFIARYNLNLLRDFCKQNNPVEIISYTGEELLRKIALPNYVLHLSRARTSSQSDFVIIFKNSRLYEHMNAITYTNRVISIPIRDIDLDDKIEIIRFTNVCNDSYNITLTGDEYYLNEFLRHGNFELYSTTVSGSDEYIEYTPATTAMHKVDIKDYKNSYNEYGKYTSSQITLADPYYLNKTLRITSKRQFHYMYKFITETQIYDIELNPEFRYSLNKNQYLVFLNHERVSPANWNLYLPDKNNPNMTPYINFAFDGEKRLLVHDDIVDIFYIPNTFIEVPLKDFEYNTNSSNDVIMKNLLLDTNGLEYMFDADLFYMFINGKKIHRSNMINITPTRVRIDLEGLNESIHDATMIKFFDPDSTLSALYSYGDLWTKSVDALSEDDYKLLFSRIKK